jgi:predicted transglutaminase-like cysteine proteinase
MNPEECASPAALRFAAIVDEASALAGRARLTAVNHAFNRAIRYMDDVDRHGVVDHWSAPLATLTAGLGDCEDYAIAKFIALREAGVADADLRIVIVRDTTLDDHHAVLAARIDGRWVVLDNRHMALREDREFAHVVPLFAIDHTAGVLQFVRRVPRPPPHTGASAISSRT